MMKWNMAKSVIVAYAIFMSGILYLVYMTQVNSFSLVRPDYYEAGEKFQERIDERQRAYALEQKPQLKLHENHLAIHFPFESKGQLKLYRPSDQWMDQELTLLANAETRLDRNKLKPGYYQAQFSWDLDGETYYWEQTLLVP